MDRKLNDITKNAAERRAARQKEGDEPKKRRPGRPRKNKEPIQQEESDPDEGQEQPYNFWKIPEWNGEEEEVEHYEEEDQNFNGESADKIKEKVELINMILELRNKMKATGTKMSPSIYNTLEELRREFDVLNNEINSRRAENAVKMITLEYLLPMIERLSPYVLPPEFDLNGLAKEGHNSYDTVFADACTHLSILHRSWFAVGPHMTYATAIADLSSKVALKNQLRKAFAEKTAEGFETAEAPGFYERHPFLRKATEEPAEAPGF